MYGFRVFELWATEGPRKTTRLEVADPLGDETSLIERAEWAVTALVPTELRTGLPDLNRPEDWEEPASPARGDIQTLLSSCEQLNPNELLVHVKHGVHGMYPEAWDRTGPIPLGQRAPTNDFRALLLMPDHGKSGRLVVETIGSTCPVTPLIRWLGFTEFEDRDPRWARLKVKQLADRERVKQMARDAERVTARLTQKMPSAPGGGGGVRAKLEVHEHSQLRREQLIEEALGWLEGGSDGDYVLRIEEIAGYDHDALDDLGLRFNKASIEVVDSNGDRRTFNPESIREKFTYPVTEDFQADDETWLARVKSVLRGPLSEGTDIQL